MTNRGVGHALLYLAAWLCVFLLAPAAFADNNVRIVRLSYVEGDVQIDRGTGQGFERAVMNMPVTQGNRIWAQGENGLVEIEFEGGSTVRLTPDSGLNVLELSRRDSGARLSMVELQQGTAYFDIRPKDDDEFRVTVNGYEVQVPNSAHFRLTIDRQEVKLALFKGTLVIPHSEGNVEVRSGETLTLDLADPGRYYLAKTISEESFDPWDNDREKYRQSYREGSYNPGYSADYSYGVTELNYWGSYSYVSGWGWMWQPYSMWAGWDPWMDGAWVWYPGLGYVWVSAYPWGWMPYRYGNWFFISGHGWCWRPGRHWHHWNTVTVAQNPPANFHPITPPRPGGGGVVPVGHGPAALIPNPQGPNWHGPVRQPVVGAPGTPVLIGGRPLPGPRGPAAGPVSGPVAGAPGHGSPSTGPTGPSVSPAIGVRTPVPTPEPGASVSGAPATGPIVRPTPVVVGGGATPPSSGPAAGSPVSGRPVVSPAAGSVKGPAVAPAPPPRVEPVEPASPPPPRAVPPPTPPPSTYSGGGYSGSSASGRSGGSTGGSSGGSTVHVSPPPTAPRSSGGSSAPSSGYSGGSRYSGGSSGAPSGGSSGGSRSSAPSGGNSSGGSHASGSSSSSSGSHSSGSATKPK